MSDNIAGNGPTVYVVRLREYAIRDVNAAHVRMAELVSEDIANEWRSGLTDALASLATMPRRCPLASERFRGEVRQLLYHRRGSSVVHRILFSIVGEQAQSPDPPTVLVLHVRNAAAHRMTRAEIRAIEADE